MNLLKTGFYFSSHLDITNSLQNLGKLKHDANEDTGASLLKRADRNFVWNLNLMQPMLVQDMPGADVDDAKRIRVPPIGSWLTVLMQGFVQSQTVELCLATKSNRVLSS